MPATDNFGTMSGGLTGPASHAFAITPHDDNELSNVTRAIYVGGAGAIKVDMAGGEEVTFTAVPVGTTLHIRAKKVHSTGTTATNLIGLY